MTTTTLYKRGALTIIAMMMANSVAALDVVCCGDGPDPDPNPGFSDELAAPEIGGGGGEEPDQPAGFGGANNNYFGNGITPECDEAGGAYSVGTHCFDADGHFVNI